MSDTVFILGAGASKAAGAPLMGEFVDVADRLRKAPISPEDKRAFDLVFKARNALQAIYAKANFSIDNIESLFGAFEMAQLLGSLPGIAPEELPGLSSAIKKVICRTLETTIEYPLRKDFPPPVPPTGYDNFVRLILDMATVSQLSSAIITFNYDIALDYAFHFFGQTPVDYALPSKPGKGVRVLKLHGSLNWHECQGCKKIIPWSLPEFFNGCNWPAQINATKQYLPISLYMNRLYHCSGTIVTQPFLIPPTWNKTGFRNRLETVWQAAAEELRDAENIIVCGFSFPQTDEFFRYLYALGSIGDASLRNFWVFDIDEEVGNRFKQLLGSSVSKRFQFFPKTFCESIGEIRSKLGVAEKVGEGWFWPKK